MRVKDLNVIQPARWLTLACYSAVVLTAVIGGTIVLAGPSARTIVVAVAVGAVICVGGSGLVDRGKIRWLDRRGSHPASTRYEALVDAGSGVAGPQPADRSLPTLVEALAAGTNAYHASIWLPAGGMMTRAAAWPTRQEDGVTKVADLAHLHAVAGIDDVVPIVDAEHVRGALAIAKSGHVSVTEDDRSFIRDMANCCALLFRGVELETELRDRVRRAEELGEQLSASQERLAHAREAERRRLASEITSVTTGNLAAIRTELRHLEEGFAAGPDAAKRVLGRLRPSLDELIEQFRAVVRGVYPGVLRYEGPRAALEELAGDLSRPVRFTGRLWKRVDWEVESGLYYVVASTLRVLGRGRSTQPLHVHFDHHDGRLTVRVDGSPDALAPSESIRTSLADDADRVAALGGGLTVDETPARASVQAWLPDKLKPVVTGLPDIPEVSTSAGRGDDTAPSATGIRTDTAMPPLEAIHRVVMAAAEKYPQLPPGDMLLEIANWLEEPLRVALAGRVGTGKSTLLNALLGQELAPTGTRECTTVATWYRNAPTCAITLYPRQGKPRPLEFAATGAAAAVKLAGIAIDTVDHLVVDWPAPELRTMTLIDLPGTDACEVNGAARSLALLAPTWHGIPSVDAIVYVMRHPHASDLRFLQDVTDDPRWRGAVGVVEVLSRADEVGQARPGALGSAEWISAKFRRNDRMRQLCRTALPVSPLLAASGATLCQPEYEAFRQLSALGKSDLDALVQNADQFAHADQVGAPDATKRAALLARFGFSGVRLAIESIRSGQVSDVGELSDALVRQGGIQPLRDLLGTKLTADANTVKARSALLAVEEVANRLPATDPYREVLRYEAERIRVGSHEFAEITLIDQLHRGGPALPGKDLAVAERLLGADGTESCSRLGLPPDADPSAIQQAAAVSLRRWQQLAESPVRSRETVEACRTLIRTCEGLMHGAFTAARISTHVRSE
jgi:energy-coupling factor transporter ATP-binding protein EcfA2